MNKKIKEITFIIAMEGEAAPFIDHYKLQNRNDLVPAHLPLILHKGSYQNLSISLIQNGKDPRFNIDNIGTQPAVLAANFAIEKLHPDLIINTGTAGGFKEKGLCIGEVVVAQGAAYFHDRRIPIPAFRSYGLGAYPLTDWTKMIDELGLSAGVISTGNAFDYSPQDKEIMAEINASIKDMEATSIAWLCHLAAVPLLIVKSVTDFVDLNNNNEKEFLENFHIATRKLKTAILSIIDWININHAQDLK